MWILLCKVSEAAIFPWLLPLFIYTLIYTHLHTHSYKIQVDLVFQEFLLGFECKTVVSLFGT
jgi:hypothetical protein